MIRGGSLLCSCNQGGRGPLCYPDPCSATISGEHARVRTENDSRGRLGLPRIRGGLSHTFREMATSTDLMSSEVHEVQEVWTCQKDLQVTYQAAKSSPKDIHIFWVVPPTESPKIMDLRGIHSPKALRQQGGQSFCPWHGKEGQNESTVVNHLCTSHYHFSLICSQCLEHFTTSIIVMHHHLQLCKLALASINDDDDD